MKTPNYYPARLCFGLHRSQTQLLWLYFLLPAFLSFGQITLEIEPVYSSNRISENAGRDIIKDKQGYIWIATIDGLNRFDGYQYKTFRSNPLDSTSLAHNYISKLFEDHYGNIWVGTLGGLHRYNQSCHCFDRAEKYRGPTGSVNDIIEDEDGRIWVASSGGIYIWDQENQTFLDRFYPETEGQENPEWRATSLKLDDRGGIWIGRHRGGLSYYHQGNFIHFLKDGSKTQVLSSAINDMFFLDDTRILIGSDDGVYLYDRSTGEIEKKLGGKNWSFFQLEDHLLANQSFDGIYEWTPGANTFEKIKVFYQGRPVDGDIQIYLKDNNGIVWTMFRGLAKYDIYEKRFEHMTHFSEDPNTLSAREVNGLSGDDDGNLAVTTQYGGLNYYDHKKKQWLNYRNTAPLNNELLKMILGTIVVLDGRDIWLEASGGVYHYNLDQGHLDKWGEKEGIEDLRSFLPDKEKKHWIVDGRIFRIDAGKNLRTYPIHDDIFSIVRDPDDIVWAISNTDIYQYDSEKDAFLHYFRYQSTQPHRMAFLHVSIDRENFWIGGMGLFHINRITKNVEYYTTADGLPNDNIVSLLSDGKYLWLSTNYGLSRFDPNTKAFLNFDKKDGLQDEIFLPNSAHRDKFGYLYFGGINGINRFHPDSLKLNNPHAPEILITELQVFNKSVSPGTGSVLQKDISQTNVLRLPYRYTPISFELTALGYSQSQKNQYAYMIEGVDLDWNYTVHNRTATYSNLPRGTHLIFKARAANHDGVWSLPKQLKIYVIPPFWQTTWFKTLFVSVSIFGIWIAYRVRIRNIRNKNKLLQREVRNQTKEIQRQAAILVEANEELQANAIAIESKAEQLRQTHQAQSQFFIGLSHELKTPLTILMGYLEELGRSDLIMSIEEIKDNMRANTQQMVKLVNQLMDKAKLESGQYLIRVCEGELAADLDSIVTGFMILARRKNIDLNFINNWKYSDATWYDRDILQKVISNLISNALKFTPQSGEVLISLDEGNDSRGKFALISVEDSGIGIPPDQLEKIFDRFYQVANQGDLTKEGTGIGLSLVKKLTELHNGKLEVTSKIGQGTRFALTLPIAKESFHQSQLEVTPDDERHDYNGNYIGGIYHEPHNLVLTNQLDKNGQHKTLLLVEDNPETRSLLKRQLQKDYLILEAENGQEGLAMAIKNIPDIIICDVVMPEMNGMDFCTHLKENVNTSHIPVVMLTALSAGEHRLQGLRQGAVTYLAKPYYLEELQLVLTNQLSHQDAIRKRFLREYQIDKLPDGLSEVDQKFMECLIRFIDSNLNESDLNVSDFCHHLGMSRTQMFRKLKSLVDMSLTEFIRDYRLKKAYQLLKDGQLNVSEIIHMTGFNSRSYFYRSFKTKFGFTPTELSGTITKSD